MSLNFYRISEKMEKVFLLCSGFLYPAKNARILLCISDCEIDPKLPLGVSIKLSDNQLIAG